MEFETITLCRSSSAVLIKINRYDKRNSINLQLLIDLHQAFDLVERMNDTRVILIKGDEEVFCTGMDFHELIAKDNISSNFHHYMGLLKRFTNSSRVIVSLVSGQVVAGGVGLVAASDLVLATPQSQFSLSEALWGLLPCCVTPFLIRRIGFQAAYRLTLTTLPIKAEEAYRLQLIDELTSDLDNSLQKYIIRFSRLEIETIKRMKAYFQQMWFFNETMENYAVNEAVDLTQSITIQRNITTYLKQGIFPWQITKEPI